MGTYLALHCLVGPVKVLESLYLLDVGLHVNWKFGDGFDLSEQPSLVLVHAQSDQERLHSKNQNS